MARTRTFTAARRLAVLGLVVAASVLPVLTTGAPATASAATRVDEAAFSEHPADLTVSPGADSPFSFRLDNRSGTMSAHLEHSRDGVGWDVSSTGSTSATARMTMRHSWSTPAEDDGLLVRFRVVLASSGEEFISRSALLTVLQPAPSILSQPASTQVREHDPATFRVVAGNAAAYQWQVAAPGSATWQDVAGATQAAHTVPATTLEMHGTRYRVLVSGSGATVAESAPATLSVVPAVPTVTAHPADASTTEGGAAVFSTAHGGTASAVAVTWWQTTVDGESTVVPDATGPTLTVTDARLAQDGSRYHAVIGNTSGSVLTRSATLTVAAALPVVTGHPVDVTVHETGEARFSAAYGGTDAPTTVQWEASTDGGATFDDLPGAHAQTAELVVEPVGIEMDGRQLRARFTNAAGDARTEAATLTVRRLTPVRVVVHPRVVVVDRLPTG